MLKKDQVQHSHMAFICPKDKVFGWPPVLSYLDWHAIVKIKYAMYVLYIWPYNVYLWSLIIRLDHQSNHSEWVRFMNDEINSHLLPS